MVRVRVRLEVGGRRAYISATLDPRPTWYRRRAMNIPIETPFRKYSTEDKEISQHDWLELQVSILRTTNLPGHAIDAESLLFSCDVVRLMVPKKVQNSVRVAVNPSISPLSQRILHDTHHVITSYPKGLLTSIFIFQVTVAPSHVVRLFSWTISSSYPPPTPHYPLE